MSVGAGCPFPVTPVCDLVGGAASGLANDVLSGIVNWVVAGASWLLDQLGSVMASSTSVDLGASWFQQHYAVMASLAAVVAVPMLLLSAIQAVYRQSAAVLARAAFVHLPLAGLLTAVAVQLVQLSLTLTDALCTTVTQSSGSDLTTTLESVAKVMVTSGASMPGFVLGLGALLVVIGALSLWLELIVRSAAVYVAVLFLPLAMASLVWPAISHWCRRLVEALASIVLSKFVVVAVLSLALGALARGAGFGALLTAGALLLLAAFMPFTLLRLVPMIESGAALQLESARQRLHQATAGIPRSAAHFAVRKAQSAGLTMDSPGTGTDVDPGLPGTDDALGGALGGAGGGDAEGDGDGSGGGLAGGGSSSGGWGGMAGGMFDPDDPGGAMDEFSSTPSDLKPPPGPIGVWPGDPRFSREALLAGVGEPQMGPLPDSVGGMPGVERPFYGPTQPPSRFEPGPKDDWKNWQPGDQLVFTGGGGPAGFDPDRYASMPYDGWAGRAPRVSAEAPIETPEDAWMWDRAVARDTSGDDQW